jgi:hypothetical protein
MLKFETLANVGDLIKAFDFKPSKHYPEEYIVGIVREKGFIDGNDQNYKAFTIEVVFDSRDTEKDSHAERSRRHQTVYVLFEVSMDYDGRVTKI